MILENNMAKSSKDRRNIYCTKLAIKYDLPIDFTIYTYCKWHGMKQLCYNKNIAGYKDYGGRGIKLFADWLDDYESFARYIYENLGERPKGYSLDRINNDGNYEPRNLRWATQHIQTNNRRKFNTREVNRKNRIDSAVQKEMERLVAQAAIEEYRKINYFYLRGYYENMC